MGLREGERDIIRRDETCAGKRRLLILHLFGIVWLVCVSLCVSRACLGKMVVCAFQKEMMCKKGILRTTSDREYQAHHLEYLMVEEGAACKCKCNTQHATCNEPFVKQECSVAFVLSLS
jgi:hypothetical protein